MKKKTAMTKRQIKILINSMQTVGMMAHDKALPDPARRLLMATFISMREVYRELGIAFPCPKNGHIPNRGGVDEQWPLDIPERWNALK